MKRSFLFLYLLASCTTAPKSLDPLPGELAFKNVRQVTFGGKDTQARWSFDHQYLIFQRKDVKGCSLVFTLDVSPSRLFEFTPSQTSSAFYVNPAFLLSKERILLSASPADVGCDDPTFLQMILLKKDGSDRIPAEPAAPRGFHSELDVCKNGRAVFTSDRDGEKTLYSADVDPSFGTLSDVAPIPRLTGRNERARFSSDCTKLVWLHSTSKGYEIQSADLDGTRLQKIMNVKEPTTPIFTPNGNHIVFAQERSLFLIQVNGRGLKRITFSDGEEKDLSFSLNGKKIVFSSSRGTGNSQMNLFIADWIGFPNEPSAGETDSETKLKKIIPPKTPVKTKIPTGKSGYLGAEIDRGGYGASALGVKITSIAAGSPAMKAGLLKGDRLVGVIGTQAFSIVNAEKFDEAMKTFKPRETITIQVRRGQQLKLIELETILGENP